MKKILLILTFIGFLGLQAQTPAPSQVSIYPNPAVSSVHITFTEPVKTEVVISISDILGNKIETFKFAADAHILIDLAALNLRTGLYLVKVETGEQTFLKRLVVKS